MNVSEMFNKWLYENYAIGNGHKLTQLQEDASVQLRFLDEMDLPEDTEIEF